MKIIDTVSTLLDRTPAVKKYVKVLSRPLRSYLDKKVIGKYNEWLHLHLPSSKELARQKQLSDTFHYRPLISIIVPVYNPPEDFFVAMLESVCAQSYENWELILVDDASPNENARELIQAHAQTEKRIKYLFLKKNHHISGASNEAMKLSSGEFVALLDNDDILQPNALYEVVHALNKNKSLDLIYSDEDKLYGGTGVHGSPYFKPSWNPDFLRSVNYITHFAVIRRSVLTDVGGFEGKYNGAQDWELFLRITRSIDASHIYHIPKILYSWRIHESSTADAIEAKPYVIHAQRSAIEDDMSARGYDDYTLRQDPLYPAQWLIEYDLKDRPLVTIVLSDTQKSSTETLRESLHYDNYEIVVRAEGETYKHLLGRTKGAYVAIMFEEIEQYHGELIQNLLADAQRPDIGFVVARYAKSEDVLININALIDSEKMTFIENMNNRDVTKHFYSTTRYNTPFVEEKSCVLIETKKMIQLVEHAKDDTIRSISSVAATYNYYNLYNPYSSSM